MEKNWLIRTKSNHILGPVSKEKVIELFKNGSIKGDDEICAGNGYWFYIREDDLIARFLTGNEVQGFNPISEAKDVLTQSKTGHELDRSQDEITLVGNMNLSQLKASEPKARPEPALPNHSNDSSKKKSKLALVEKEAPAPREKKVHKSQSFLQYLVIAGFILIFCLVYFRKSLIKTIFTSATVISTHLIADVHAQDPGLQAKKKSF